MSYDHFTSMGLSELLGTSNSYVCIPKSKTSLQNFWREVKVKYVLLVRPGIDKFYLHARGRCYGYSMILMRR